MLDVFIYENDGCKIAYAPALDLMGYGKSVDDAKDSFEIVAEDFFETAVQRNTLGFSKDEFDKKLEVIM